MRGKKKTRSTNKAKMRLKMVTKTKGRRRQRVKHRNQLHSNKQSKASYNQLFICCYCNCKQLRGHWRLDYGWRCQERPDLPLFSILSGVFQILAPVLAHRLGVHRNELALQPVLLLPGCDGSCLLVHPPPCLLLPWRQPGPCL